MIYGRNFKRLCIKQLNQIIIIFMIIIIVVVMIIITIMKKSCIFLENNVFLGILIFHPAVLGIQTNDKQTIFFFSGL